MMFLDENQARSRKWAYEIVSFQWKARLEVANSEKLHSKIVCFAQTGVVDFKFSFNSYIKVWEYYFNVQETNEDYMWTILIKE
jgi:hypothetical protein